MKEDAKCFKKLNAKHKHPLMKLNKEMQGENEYIESSHEKCFNGGHAESEFCLMSSHLREIIAWASRQPKNE